jgi:hypothetical protein
MISDHITTTVTLDTILAFHTIGAGLSMKQPDDVTAYDVACKTPFGISVYSKEYTFPILFCLGGNVLPLTLLVTNYNLLTVAL